MQTKSSGRLPTADWTMPVAAAPRWLPSWSVASPIRWAMPASASAATAKVEERRGAGDVQHAGERHHRRRDRHHRQVATLHAAIPAVPPPVVSPAGGDCKAAQRQRAAARPAWRPVARQAVRR